MNILVTLPDRPRGTQTFFTEKLATQLEHLGSVQWNESASNYTPDELSDNLEEVDICVTGWGTPCLDEEVINSVNDCRIKLVAHVGGSVAGVVDTNIYKSNIDVCSANGVMAKFVGEYLIAATLTGLRSFPSFDTEMKAGKWVRDNERVETLFGKTIGFVGLGSIGRHFLEHLRSFDVNVAIYDPYLTENSLADWGFAKQTDLKTVLATADVLSIHASKTEETIHLIDEKRLSMLQDGCLLVNAARGAIVDTDALIRELRMGRISAVLDVYERKTLEPESELREIDNVILTPHMAGSAIRVPLAAAMINEIERFTNDQPLQYRIPRKQYELMTRPWIHADET